MKSKNVSNNARIFEFIRKHSAHPMKIKDLARAIGIESKRYSSFRLQVRAMIDSGKLVRLKRGRIGLPDQMDLITGQVSITRSGVGFMKCDDSEEEIFVAARDLSTALDGDRVVLRLKSDRTFRDKREGIVLSILKRERSELVGRFCKGRGNSFIVPDLKKIHRDIYIAKEYSAGAKEGEKVVVRLEDWTDPYLNPEGRVIERLGMTGNPEADTLSIIRSFELPTEFPDDVLTEAGRVASNLTDESKERVDLTHLTLFTIDPADAKDHDDAVSIEKTGRNFRLGVHIADVSHFVRGGSKLDKEAFNRGTSVYFPDRVIPMLPEMLSNDACSLRPRRKRLAFSIFIDFDTSGKVVDYTLHPSVVKSRAKLSYSEVQSLFDGEEPTAKVARVAKDLLMMRKLARLLLKRRQESGSLDFDLSEAKIILDKQGNVIEIGSRVRKESHRLVEEFMLAANRQVAIHFFRHALPTLYRVHDRPDKDKLEVFSHLVKGFGYSFPVSPQMPLSDFSNFVKKVKGKPEEELVNELLLRAMQKAVYQPRNIGHFGLAFTHYLHFTSPIRRYPDLLVHRLLKQIKKGRYPAKLHKKLGAVLTNVGKRSSELERRAMEVEREAIKAKQVAFMASRLGEEYDGVISGVTNYGFFVRLIEPGCEGLVRVSSLDDDYYHFEESKFRMVGRRRGRVFRLGDKVKVAVTRADPETKEIDLHLVQSYQNRSKSKGKRSLRTKRK